MPAPDPLLFILPNLNRLHIPYAVSGGVAAIYYGDPRFTNDADIVLYRQAEDVPRLAAAFPPDQYDYPPEEVIRLELEKSAPRPFQSHPLQERVQSGHLPQRHRSASRMGAAEDPQDADRGRDAGLGASGVRPRQEASVLSGRRLDEASEGHSTDARGDGTGRWRKVSSSNTG